MQSVTLATSKFMEQFKIEFSKEYQNFLKNGIKISLDESFDGKIYSLDFNFRDNALNDGGLKKYFTNSISNFIFNYWEKKLVQAIIQHDYSNLSSPVQDYIYGKVIFRLDEMDKNVAFEYGTKRKRDMNKRLESFLKENTYLNIDGFIQFRNKEYLEELRKYIDIAAEEYYIDQEYFEFINLLKSLIQWTEPKVENIHVVFLPSGGFQLFDNQDKVIDNNYLDGFLLDFEEGIINYDDLLISSLINISPKNVILHITKPNEYNEMMKIITQVFENRVSYCQGCKRCLSINNKQKN